MIAHANAIVDEIRSAWRFRRQAAVTTCAVAAIAWTAAFLVPSKYESTARVFVDTNALLRPLLEGIAVTNDGAAQVELVRRALLGRPQIESVIDATDLKLRYRDARGRDMLVRDLMRDIQITAGASTPNAREANIFAISYADPDPQLAYTVVSTLLERLVSQSLGENRSDADKAQKFLRDQIADYEARLSASEARLADFKKRNVGSMPDERGDYFRRLQSDMAAYDQATSSLNVALRRRDELRRKLLGGIGPQAAEDPGTASNGTSQSLETSVDARLREASARLEELLLRYTDAHPDVIALRDTIARLEQQRSEELAALRQNVGALGSPRATSSLVAQNLQIALNQADLEVATLQTQAADYGRRVADLRARMNTLPEVEAELLKLTRDYDVTKAEYEKLLQRLESARLSDAADRVDDVRFRVIDPPVRELVPSKPKRWLLIVAGLFVAIGSGAGLAWLIGRLNPVIQRVASLDRFGAVAFVAALPLLEVDEVARARRRAIWRYAGVFAAVFATSVVLIVFHGPIERAATAALHAGGAS